MASPLFNHSNRSHFMNTAPLVFTFREAVPADVTRLADLFWASLNAHPAYISHSEIQTGIALDSGIPAPNGRTKWERYILGKITHSRSRVWIAEQGETLAGFVVQSFNTDYERTFGVIDDLLVAASLRGSGLGGDLLEAGIAWLREQGACDIYLESGVDNHAAHAFFERHQFRCISHMFKLT